ncbi:hypothetical protein [Cohnella sp. JJ-181]|uniref:hypothetical protein n=1 Tax=Cohnella rhizoplanae TaxID=2974897 RepID=UPI0022FF6162|nr:hypothetical protein [Cohnella sp. JJ-181]CAI6087151.1 hypothetical protein COHCIP112018_05355 [Cohnella sp. JJ-181]
MDIHLSKYDEGTLALRFDYDRDTIDLIKTLPGRRWVPEAIAWTVPYTLAMAERLLHAFPDRLNIEAGLREECYLFKTSQNARNRAHDRLLRQQLQL